MKSVHIGPFLGMNNQLPQTQYTVPDQGDFVRDARNVDILDSGTLRRRSGYTKLLDGRFSSLYAMGSTALCVHDGHLCRVNALPDGQWNTVQLCPVRGATVSYAPVGEQVFCTDGDSVWRYAGMAVIHNAVAAPQAPLVEMSTGGLPEGAYRFLCTRVRAFGEESAAGASAEAILDGSSGVTVTVDNTPDWPDERLCLYMTTANGEVFYRVAYVNAGETVTVASMPDLHGACQTMDLAPMPAGDIIRFFGGRLFTAKGPVLYSSRPYAHGLHHPEEDFFQFPQAITKVETVPDGMYICADRTWFMSSDFASMREVLPYGAIKGDAARMPDGSLCWTTPRGIVQAMPGGEIRNIQEGKVKVDIKTDTTAGTTLIERDGLQQVVSTRLVRGSNSAMGVGSFMDAQIIRKGT